MKSRPSKIGEEDPIYEHEHQFRTRELLIAIGLVGIVTGVPVYFLDQENLSTLWLVIISSTILVILLLGLWLAIRHVRNRKVPNAMFAFGGALLNLLLICSIAFIREVEWTSLTRSQSQVENSTVYEEEGTESSINDSSGTESVQRPVENSKNPIDIKNKKTDHSTLQHSQTTEIPKSNQVSDYDIGIFARPDWAREGMYCYLRLGVVRNGVWTRTLFKDLIHVGTPFNINTKISAIKDDSVAIYKLCSDMSERWITNGKRMEFRGATNKIDTVRINGRSNHFWCWMKFKIMN